MGSLQVEPTLFTDVGFKLEKWEELRQAGLLWFLDLSVDEAIIEPLNDLSFSEMWGGLYASGHIEIIKNGELPLKPLIEGMEDSMKKAGFQPYISQNQAGQREILIYAQGIRSVISSKIPVYSIHMDSEISSSYELNRKKFDTVCKGYLDTINQVAKDYSVNIANPYDLDFSYTNSSNSFTVLKSLGADSIADPIGIAIRDWHRKRGK